MAIETKNRGQYCENLTWKYFRARNHTNLVLIFAQFRANQGFARKLVHAKISTNKVNGQWLATLVYTFFPVKSGVPMSSKCPRDIKTSISCSDVIYFIFWLSCPIEGNEYLVSFCWTPIQTLLWPSDATTEKSHFHSVPTNELCWQYLMGSGINQTLESWK